MSGRRFGSKGEEVARDYLISNGYKIEALNWRKSRYEIDIVAVKKNVLAFIEVKSSRRAILGPPESRVNKTKQKRIAQAASEYLSELEYIPENIRFDVISVLWASGENPTIEHIESAYMMDSEF